MSTGVTAQTWVPRVVAVLALSVFVLGTSEFMITGLLPEMARDLAVSIPATGYLISAFAIGMIVGAPLMAIVTLALPRRTTLVASLLVFVVGHVLAALASDYGVVLVARVVTALRRRRSGWWRRSSPSRWWASTCGRGRWPCCCPG